MLRKKFEKNGALPITFIVKIVGLNFELRGYKTRINWERKHWKKKCFIKKKNLLYCLKILTYKCVNELSYLIIMVRNVEMFKWKISNLKKSWT